MDKKLWQQTVDTDEHNDLVMEVKAEGIRPRYANGFAAGMDLVSNGEEDIVIPVGGQAKVPTKLKVALPRGTFGMVVPRSGISIKKGITLVNDIGIIDEDYRGEIGVILMNEGREEFTVKQGDRVAQMVIIPYVQPTLVFVDELDETERGEGGFGSTGR